MFFKKIIAFLTAVLIAVTGGVAPVIGSADVDPIIATERSYRFDQEKLQFGVYCFRKDGHYSSLRRWFKEAGLDFAVCVSGEQLTKKDLNWLEKNGIGIIAPNTEYYRGLKRDCLWGIDYRDEPNSADFEALGNGVRELYAEDENRFPLINLFPMYASGSQLGEDIEVPGLVDSLPFDSLNVPSRNYRVHVAKYLGAIDSDIISVDIYPLNINYDTGELETWEYWLRNIDILADACRQTNRDLWVITQAAGIKEETGGSKRYCDTPEDQRWQNFVSLAFGAKAIIYGCYYSGWWDGDSHMIDDYGKRTETYDAVARVNEEMSVFAEEYAKYENHGAVIYNRLNPDCAGARLGLTKVCKQYTPAVLTGAPVLCGCFSEKDGDGSAYVFTNMYEPQTGKEAKISACFPGAESVTVYRKGEVTVIDGNKLDITLENREGIFVTVK